MTRGLTAATIKRSQEAMAERQGGEPEHRGDPRPAPRITPEEAARQLAEDPEFLAWVDEERHRMPGR